MERHPRSRTYEMRNAQVRIAQACAGFFWVSEFGECGDSRCGCYRLWRPDVRRRFRENVVKCTLEQLGACGRVRYVTVGSGSLLTDFEILCALRAANLIIASIVAVDTCYDDWRTSTVSEESAPTKALRQLGDFFAPATVYAFDSVERFTAACELQPHAYANATTFVHCDAGDIKAEDSTAAAVAALVDGGCSFKLNNLGMGARSATADGSADGADAHGAHSGDPAAGLGSDPDEGSKTRRQYWRAQLRDGSSIEAWRRKPDAPHSDALHASLLSHLPTAARKPSSLLAKLPDSALAEADEKRAARHSMARQWISQSSRERAASLSLSLYKVVFQGTNTTRPDGKPVPESLRDTVAVREAPSRTAQMVATRKRGDEILVAEESGGWVRISEEDDEWGWQLSFASTSAAAAEDAKHKEAAQMEATGSDPSPPQARVRQAWMLIDATALGMGRLLERQAV